MIKGKHISSAHTINSMYANGYIELRDEKENKVYRIHVDEILKMIQKNEFTAEMKKKYEHLTLV